VLHGCKTLSMLVLVLAWGQVLLLFASFLGLALGTGIAIAIAIVIDAVAVGIHHHHGTTSSPCKQLLAVMVGGAGPSSWCHQI
jgi:hypothetical protein